MEGLLIAGAAAAAIFGGGVAGALLGRNLPERFTTGGGRDMVGAVGGLLTLLSALVLGLLIVTAYGVYSGQVTAVRNLAADALELDLALADYGPDAAAGRTLLQGGVQRTIDQVWGPNGDNKFLSAQFEAAIRGLRKSESYFNSLHPTTDAQKAAFAAADRAAASIGQTRLQMALALIDPLSRALIVVVVAWAVLLFFGLGFMHGLNTVTLATLAVGTIAVSSAIYLIIDLSSPYSGLFKVSPAPIEQVLKVMNKQP